MEINDLKKYMKHLPTCYKMQDWTEAQQAMGDTPEKFRDESWYLSYEEMRQKMNTCTCGLEKLLKENGALLISDVSWQSELLISLIKELINVGIIDKNDINTEVWVENYLKEINSN
jgi:hypothetical protein